MPDRWRLGTRNPFTVYRVADGAHDVEHAREHFVCAFRREEDADLAVDAVNAWAARWADPLSLDELTTVAEAAFECADITVEVREADGTESTLRRLVRCLRSAGLLDERRDRDDDETEEDARLAVDAVNAPPATDDDERAERELTDALHIVRTAQSELLAANPKDTGANELEQAARLLIRWRPSAVKARRRAQPTTPPSCDCPDTDGAEPAGSADDEWVDDPSRSDHPVYECNLDHWCAMCGDPASHKVGEEAPTRVPDNTNDAMIAAGHNLTNWLCCLHFRSVIGDCGDRRTGDDRVNARRDDPDRTMLPPGSAVGQRGAPTRDEVWVSGNPDGPWRRASDIGRDEVVDDQELFRWIERVLKEMVKAAVPAMVLTYRDEQDRRARMHVSMGQLRRLWTLAAVRDDDGGEMGRKITALANAAGIDRDDLDWEDALGCVTVILDALRAKAGGTANDLVAPAVTLRVGAAGSVAPDLSRIARPLGVSLDPDDPDPVGRLVEAAGKAREMEVVGESDEMIVAQYTDTENLPGWRDMVADLRAIGKPPIVTGEYARTKLPVGSWVASLADDGTVQLDGAGQPWPLHRAEHLGNTRRTRERSFVVVYRAPAPAPAALTVGEVVETAADLDRRASVGTIVDDGLCVGRRKVTCWTVTGVESLASSADFAYPVTVIRVGTGGGES